MRPYLAIIKDSFREALASRVLWVLLLLITALLIALIPFHWRSTIASEMIDLDIRNIRNISEVLKAGENPEAPPRIAYIWSLLSPRTQRRLAELKNRNGPRAFQARKQLAEDFNKIIRREDFFDEGLWADTKLIPRAEALRDTPNLSGDALYQFNRLAIESALPGQLRPCPEEAMIFRYAKWNMDFVPPIPRRLAVEMIDRFVLGFMALFVGFFGIFAAILVTAPIIPGMLDSGSLYVLLSKPVSRPLIFIAKFIGGCSFVFINASYLIVGLWLILGFRFEIWKPQILWSIPIFLFSFAIFYSVSSLAGLFWRSTVMAIVATILFWFLCRAVGSTKDLIEQFVIVPDKIDRIVRYENGYFVTRRNGGVGVWNPATKSFDEIFEPAEAGRKQGPEMIMGMGSPLASLIYLPEQQQLLGWDRKWSQSSLLVGTETGGWRRESTIQAPPNTRALFLHNGQPTVVADGGVYHVDTAAKDQESEGGINIFGFVKIPPPKGKEPHVTISEGIGDLPGDSRIAYDAANKDIYIQGARRLVRLSIQEAVFREIAAVDVDWREVVAVSAGGGVVAVAHRTEDDTVLEVVDGQTLATRQQLTLDDESDVRRMAVSVDGRWIGVLFDNDELFLFDLENNRQVKSTPFRHATVGFRFNEDRLLVADANDQIVTIGLSDLKQRQQISANLPFIKKLYRYLVMPLYLVCPKTAELQNTMQYAITGKDTIKVEAPGLGPNGRTIKLNPWQPLISNSFFIAVMLLIGCIYVYRQDF